jgi:hypothetical protein
MAGGSGQTMYLVLLLIGLAATTAGAATIGFGIPINEFSLGHTLIIAGTIALGAGLVLVGLAAALRQLERIAEALTTRGVARAVRPPEPEAARPAAARMAFPPKPSEAEARPEPRFVPAGGGTPGEEAPLSPQVSRGAAAPRLDPPWRPILPTEPERPAKNAMFDNLWPVGPRMAEPEPAKSPAPSPQESTGEQAPQAEERRTVSILKSGVVDGMAYTLYADGSIEAELPEGTVRFASIDELRDHLEKHS